MDDPRVGLLEDKIASLTARLDALSATGPGGGQVVDTVQATDDTESRRHLLKRAGVVAVGAAVGAVALTANPAAAIHAPEDLGLGLVNPTSPAATNLKTTLNLLSPTPGGSALLVQTGTGFANGDASFPAAVSAWATIDTHPTGLYAYTAASLECSAIEAVGVGSKSVGIRASGARANIVIAAGGTAGPTRTDAHGVGEVINDANGNLWFCVAAGTPGTWKKIGGPGVAGSFHALTPGRVYDSRQTLPSPGVLASPSNRTISVADRRDANLSTGAVIAANFVPAGATAVTANVTVTETSSAGYLTVNPGGNLTVGASTINWSGNNLNIANGVTLTLDGSRQLTVIAGGGGSTHFIIDITGYYL